MLQGRVSEGERWFSESRGPKIYVVTQDVFNLFLSILGLPLASSIPWPLSSDAFSFPLGLCLWSDLPHSTAILTELPNWFQSLLWADCPITPVLLILWLFRRIWSRQCHLTNTCSCIHGTDLDSAFFLCKNDCSCVGMCPKRGGKVPQ